MLTELLGVIEKTNSRPFLVSFVTLSLATEVTNGSILADPFSWQLAVLVVLGFCSYALVFGWIYAIVRMNFALKEGDIANWGPIIGSILLAIGLLITFSYLASHPQGLSFSILGEPSFIYVCTLYLLAAETVKIRR